MFDSRGNKRKTCSEFSGGDFGNKLSGQKRFAYATRHAIRARPSGAVAGEPVNGPAPSATININDISILTFLLALIRINSSSHSESAAAA